MKNIKHIAVIGAFSTTTAQKIQDFAEEKDIKVEELNPFGPEPFVISNPERMFREEIRNTKYFEKSKSKFHK